jgi:O-antigen biosynthesis protein
MPCWICVVCVSIVTALYNRLDLTQAFWASLQANPPAVPWEIIWIDDGSSDGTREWLSEIRASCLTPLTSSSEHQAISTSVSSNRAPLMVHCSNPPQRIQVILNDKNLGYAANNNLGAKAAQGDVLVFFNNDLVLTEGWFEPMARALASSADIGVVGNVQLQPATGLIDHAGIIFNLSGLPEHHLRARRPEAARGVGAFHRGASAACWMVRRSVFLEAGGFDERYRNGGEDVDLCLRLTDRGLRHWVSYESRVWHHVSSSPGRHEREQANLALFLSRWGSRTALWGRVDWPRFYLSRHRHHWRRLNFVKTIDAVLRIAGLRKGDSKWAKERRRAVLSAFKCPE